MNLLTITLLSLGLASSAIQDDEADLERSLDAIRTETIRADLVFIASDELQGRETPSPGLKLAARYLKTRVQRLGFTPAGDDGFLDEYVIHEVWNDVERTTAAGRRGDDELSLRFGEGFYFFPGGEADLDVEGPVVYVGKASKDDVKALDLSGRWALAHTSREVNWRERRENVHDRGAVGLLLVSGPHEEEGEYERYAKRFSTRQRGRLCLELTTFPNSYLSAEVGAWLLPAGTETPTGEELDVRWRETRVLDPRSTVHDAENVAALWPGDDPELSREVVILTAHYDHEGVRDGEIYNGADDNGSGTVALLAVADALADYGPMRRSVLLLWVSGGEKGLLGSIAWAKEPTLPEAFRAVANLNVDTIGRNSPNQLLVTPSKDHEEYNGLTRLVESLAPREGFSILESADAFWRRSDHAIFSRNLGLPVVFLFSGLHSDYTKPTDTAEKIDCDKVGRISRLMVRMLHGMQADELDL